MKIVHKKFQIEKIDHLQIKEIDPSLDGEEFDEDDDDDDEIV
jgi:hypothetical protein